MNTVGKVKDFFDMSRNERRGAIVVLAIIAAVLVATCAVRCNREPAPPVPAVDIHQFEAELDSSAVLRPRAKPKKPVAPKKKRRPAASKPSKPTKPAPAPRRLDPVPQI